MSTQRVRRGMHVRLVWPILRAGVPEDFTNAEALSIHLTKIGNSAKVFIPDTHISIVDNVVSFIVTDEMQKALTSGEYEATIAYRKVSATSPTMWEPYVKDEPCFKLVDTSSEIGGTTTGMEVVTVTLSGEMGTYKEGLPGASAYQTAVAHGFEGDEAEWLLSLKQPAIDAAGLAIQAAGAADAAAGKANTATSDLETVKRLLAEAESGRNTAEAARETKEGQRNQAEQERNTAEGGRNTAEGNRETKEGQRNQAEQERNTSEGGRNTAEGNRETKEGQRNQAEQERNTAEGGRNTAEGNRETKEGQRQESEQQRAEAEITRGNTFDQKIQSATDATTAANAAANAQNTYNVTVAVPLAAGVYYTKTTARAGVPAVSRKLGLVLTYSTADKVWYSEKYIGSTVAVWTTESNWEQVPDAAKLAAIETDLNEKLEPALAEVLNNLHGRIVAFEQLIKAMIFRSMQIDNLDVVKNLTIHGSTNLFLTGVSAPVNLPDFAGQYYIDTANRVGYLALSESVWLKIADAVEVAANSADMVSIKNNQEPAMAEIINHLNARILALESIIKNGLFKNTQIDTADIVKSLNLYGGTNLILIRTVAPAEVPDFIGQTYVNTAAGVAYEAVGTTSVSNWKQKTN